MLYFSSLKVLPRTKTRYTQLQVTKHQVDQFVPGCQVPSCQLFVKWTGQQGPPVELAHSVDLLGVKEPFNFFFDSTSFTTTITVSTTTSKYMLMHSVKCLLG